MRKQGEQKKNLPNWGGRCGRVILYDYNLSLSQLNPNEGRILPFILRNLDIQDAHYSSPPHIHVPPKQVAVGV